MRKSKITYDRFYFQNRWKRNKYSRNCDWTIVGLSVWWSCPTSFCYTFSLFGLELKIWFTRDFIINSKNN